MKEIASLALTVSRLAWVWTWLTFAVMPIGRSYRWLIGRGVDVPVLYWAFEAARWCALGGRRA